MSDEETPKPEAQEGAEAAAKAPATETPAAEQATPKAEETKKAAEAPKADESPKAEGEGAPAEEKKRDVFAEIMGDDTDLKVKVFKAKGSKGISKGIVHITATFNNTVVTVTDQRGNAIGWSSAGKMGFRGSRKSTAYAAQVVSQDACRQAMGHGLKEVDIRVKGPGAGREAAVRAVQGLGIDVNSILDVTPVPHNGCRPKKARRV